MPKRIAYLLITAAALLLLACGDSGATSRGSIPAGAGSEDGFRVGRPQNRAGIGDVDRAFDRYEATRGELVALFQAQSWFKDGLSRDEALFVERSLTFVGSYSGPRRAYVSDETIAKKLYRYERVSLSRGEVEILLIFEPGQDGDREMETLSRLVPALEAVVGVEYPERVMTVVNGAFEINDFNDGQFIRIARCCLLTPFVLAHELAHTYWSMGPSWFNEGLADIYAILTIERLNREMPPGWRATTADLDGHYRSRKSAVESGRFPEITLPRRFASDGLYEVADVFLLDIRRLIGDDGFLAAARDLYLTSDFGRINLREKRIEDVFLQHAKAGLRDDVMALFNRVVWGDNGERYRQLKEIEAS